MTSATMRLQMVMELADRLSAPMNQVTQRTEHFNREVSESQQRLDELGNTRRVLEQFRQLRQRTQQTSTALEEAQRETADVAREFNRTTNPTTALTRRMQEATAQTRALQQQHQEERQELQQLRLQLQQAGLSTTNLEHATLSLQRRTDRYNRELEEQQRQIERTQSAQERLNRLQERSSELKSKLMGDTAKLGGAVFAVKKLSDAYADVASAKGEIASLGIDADGQNIIAEKAREYSNQWAGTTAAEFISASYDIKSGISSLGNEAVGEFTKIAALTGGATKSSTAQMTSLFASGYAIYRKQFEGFAKTYINDWEQLSAEEKDIKFGEMFSSGISSSVQAFKTDGSKVSQAMSTLGDTATAAGASMAEQFSILGILSASKEGGEAATKYKRFIEKAVKAGQNLDLDFLDAENNLLPTVEILKKIRDEFGELNGVEKDTLTDAFGSTEAKDFVEAFLPKIAELEESVGSMQTSLQGGMAVTNKMANDMLVGGPHEALGRMGNQFNNLAVKVGEIFAPAVMSVAHHLGHAAEIAQGLIIRFPAVSKAILLGASAFVAIKVAMIAGRSAMLAWNAVNMIGVSSTNALTFSTMRLAAAQRLATVQTKLFAAAQAIWNAVFSRSPMGLLIKALALLGILIYNFSDQFKVFFQGVVKGFFTMFAVIMDAVQPVMDIIKNIWDGLGEMLAPLLEKIEPAIKWCKDLLAPLQEVINNFEGIRTWGEYAGVGLFVLTGVFAALKLKMIAVNLLTKTWRMMVVAATAAQWLWNFALAANPIYLIITAVGALIGIAAYLVDDWGAVGRWFSGLCDDIKALFWKCVEFIKTIFSYTPLGMLIENWQPILGFFGGLCDGIKNMFFAAWEWVKESIIGPLLEIKNTLGAAWNKLFGDDDKSVEVTQKVKKISDHAVKIAQENPDISHKVKQSEPIAPIRQASVVQNTNNMSFTINGTNLTKEEIGNEIVKKMDEHQRKSARSIRGNLHD